MPTFADALTEQARPTPFSRPQSNEYTFICQAARNIVNDYDASRLDGVKLVRADIKLLDFDHCDLSADHFFFPALEHYCEHIFASYCASY
jgi:hypothetical protein